MTELAMQCTGRRSRPRAKHIPDNGHFPRPDSLSPGGEVRVAGADWTVIECAEARVAAAEGELPYVFDDTSPRPYADLRSKDGAKVGTLDYADEVPVLHEGRIVEQSGPKNYLHIDRGAP